LFVCFQSHEQFSSYLASVTSAGDRAANLDLCLVLMTFSCQGSFTCHTYCDTGPPFLAHLSWKLKWAILIARCPSSVCPSVCPSVCL
jgi:hypothetical protein